MRTGLDAKRKLFALQTCGHQGILTGPYSSPMPTGPRPAPSPPSQGSAPGGGAQPAPPILAAPVCLGPSSRGALGAPREDERQRRPGGFWCRVQAEAGWQRDGSGMASTSPAPWQGGAPLLLPPPLRPHRWHLRVGCGCEATNPRSPRGTGGCKRRSHHLDFGAFSKSIIGSSMPKVLQRHPKRPIPTPRGHPQHKRLRF